MNISVTPNSKALLWKDLLNFARDHVISLSISLLIFFLGMGILGAVLETQIEEFALWVDGHFGFWGLAIALFMGDTFVSPIPPDVVLLLISQGPMSEEWPFYVFIFGFISSIAGVHGWLIGKALAKSKYAARFGNQIRHRYGDQVKRFGFWAVIIGAITPFPFSITCWTAGYLGLPFLPLFFATLVRIPRFYLYYFVIAYGLSLAGFF